MKTEMWRSKMVQALRISEDLTDRELAEKLSACRDQEGRRCNLPMCQRCVVDPRSLLFEEVMEYQTSLLRGLPVPLICWSKAVPGES